MPTYDYLCEACGPFEEFQSISAPKLEKCPKCGGKAQRLISRNVNIIFKGSGYYTTDNRKADYKAAEKADKGGSESSSASSSSGTPAAASA